MGLGSRDLRLTRQQCQRLGVSLAIGCGGEYSAWGCSIRPGTSTDPVSDKTGNTTSYGLNIGRAKTRLWRLCRACIAGQSPRSSATSLVRGGSSTWGVAR